MFHIYMYIVGDKNKVLWIITNLLLILLYSIIIKKNIKSLLYFKQTFYYCNYFNQINSVNCFDQGLFQID